LGVSNIDILYLKPKLVVVTFYSLLGVSMGFSNHFARVCNNAMSFYSLLGVSVEGISIIDLRV